MAFARKRDPAGLLAVVGHSVGGVVIGYAASAPQIDRILTVGAQHAHWRDYAPAQRAALRRRWHRVMPALVERHGYFPGRRLGWLENLPAVVARDFAAANARFEDGLSRPAGAGTRALRRRTRAAPGADRQRRPARQGRWRCGGRWPTSKKAERRNQPAAAG